MEPRMIVGQILGVIGAIIAISSFQCKESKKLFLVQILSTAVFSVQFYLLSANTGMILNIAGLIRAVFLYYGDKKWARHPVSLVSIMLLMIVCGVITWDGWISLLPTIAMVVGTPFLWTQNGKTLRLAQLFCISPCWLTYNAIVLSIAGVGCECFNIASVIISIRRFGLNGLNTTGNVKKDAEPMVAMENIKSE